MIDDVPDAAVAGKPLTVPFEGPDINVYVSVWLRSASVTASSDVISFAPEFSQTVNACGLLLLNVGGTLSGTTFIVKTLPVLVHSLLLVTVSVPVYKAIGAAAGTATDIGVALSEAEYTGAKLAVPAAALHAIL